MAKQRGVSDVEQLPTDAVKGNDGWVVIIFNNDHNSTDEVIAVLMAATGCAYDEAYCEMWEAHNFGRATVHFSGEAECREVAKTVSSIGVKTEVRKEWD